MVLSGPSKDEIRLAEISTIVRRVAASRIDERNRALRFSN